MRLSDNHKDETCLGDRKIDNISTVHVFISGIRRPTFIENCYVPLSKHIFSWKNWFETAKPGFGSCIWTHF